MSAIGTALRGDESLIIKRPSNRHLIAVMESWGWIVKRTNGNIVVMKWLWSTDDGKSQLAYVNAATHGAPTKDAIIKKIIDITTGGDVSRFWKVVPAPRSDLTRPQGLVVNVVNDFPQSPVKAATKRKLTWEQLSMPELEPAPKPDEEKEAGDMRKKQERGTAAAVLQVLIKVGQPMNGQAIHAHLPEHSLKAITNALYYLHHVKQADRVLNGTYRVADRNRAGDALHVDGRPRLQVTYADVPTASESTVATVTTERVTATVENWTVQSLPDDATDDMMDAMLDLMFPDGFKAMHLSSITSWKNETRRLIVKING